MYTAGGNNDPVIVSFQKTLVEVIRQLHASAALPLLKPPESILNVHLHAVLAEKNVPDNLKNLPPAAQPFSSLLTEVSWLLGPLL